MRRAMGLGRRAIRSPGLAPTRAPPLHSATPCHYISDTAPAAGNGHWVDAWGGARRDVVARGWAVGRMGPRGCQAWDDPKTVEGESGPLARAAIKAPTPRHTTPVPTD